MGFKSISSTPQQKKCLLAHAFGQISDKILNQSNKNTSDLDFSPGNKKGAEAPFLQQSGTMHLVACLNRRLL